MRRWELEGGIRETTEGVETEDFGCVLREVVCSGKAVAPSQGQSALEVKDLKKVLREVDRNRK